jgi:hypothetical protein
VLNYVTIAPPTTLMEERRCRSTVLGLCSRRTGALFFRMLRYTAGSPRTEHFMRTTARLHAAEIINRATAGNTTPAIQE